MSDTGALSRLEGLVSAVKVRVSPIPQQRFIREQYSVEELVSCLAYVCPHAYTKSRACAMLQGGPQAMAVRPGQPCPELPQEIWGRISEYLYPWEWAHSCAPVCRALRAMPVSMLHMEARMGSAARGAPAAFSPPLSWLSAAWERLRALSLAGLSPKHARMLEAAMMALAATRCLTTLRIAHFDAFHPVMLSGLLALVQARMPCLRQLYLAVALSPVMPAFERLQHLHMQATAYDDVFVASLLRLPKLRTLCLESPDQCGPRSVSVQMGTLNLETMRQVQHLSLLRVEPSRVRVVGSCSVHVTFTLAAASFTSWARVGARHVTLDCMSATCDEVSRLSRDMQQAVFSGGLQSLSIRAERLGSSSLPFGLKGPVFSQITSLTLLAQFGLAVSIPRCMPLRRLLIAAPNPSLEFEDVSRFAGRIEHLGVWMHDIECPPYFQEMHGLLLARGLQLVHGENLRWNSHAFIQGCDYDPHIPGAWPVDHTMCDCTACWSCLKRRGIVEVNKYGVG